MYMKNGKPTNGRIFRNVPTYDSTGKMLTEVDQAWNSLSPSWVNYSRYTYTYNSAGNLLTELDEVGQYNEWSLYEIYTYSYDSSGNSADPII